MEDKSLEYKSYYTGIFSLNYFVQGINQSILPIVIPIYILNLNGYVNAADIATLGTIVMIPFIMKLLFGLISDKVEIGKFGRRKPWIFGPATFSGIMWLIIPALLLQNPKAAIQIFTIVGFFIMFGTAMSDTAMDGFILDITPKNRLGRVTGAVWGIRSIGIIAGGIVVLMLIRYLQIEIIFIALGVMTIIFGWLTIIIKHSKQIKDREIIKNLKIILKKGENWKVFIFSTGMAIVDGVIFLFITLYVLIKAEFVNPIGATIEILETDLNLYEPQAFITLIVSLGVVFGAFLCGRVADKKSRRIAVFFKFILTTGSLILLLIPIPSGLIFVLLIFTFIAGSSSGWSYAAFSAVVSEYAKKYPDATGTYFSLCNSFINFSSLLGLSITGLIFQNVTAITTNVSEIYAILFIAMAILCNLAIIPFLLLDRKEYEYKLEEK